MVINVYFTSRPQDFAIGAKIEIFKHQFIITDADDYVLKYMEAHAEEFPAETLESLQTKKCSASQQAATAATAAATAASV